MESITLGQVAVALAFVISLIGSVGYLKTHIEGWISQAMRPQIDEVKAQLNDLSERISTVDQEATKNFLVEFLSDLERSGTSDEVELARFWEQYEHYVDAGGNSYIKRKVEQLKSEGKL